MLFWSRCDHSTNLFTVTSLMNFSTRWMHSSEICCESKLTLKWHCWKIPYPAKSYNASCQRKFKSSSQHWDQPYVTDPFRIKDVFKHGNIPTWTNSDTALYRPIHTLTGLMDGCLLACLWAGCMGCELIYGRVLIGQLLLGD